MVLETGTLRWVYGNLSTKRGLRYSWNSATVIMSGGDIKGGHWPRDVHESSVAASHPLSGGPLLPLLLARGSLLLVRFPKWGGEPVWRPPTHPLSGRHHLPAGGAAPYGGTGSHQKTYGEHHFDWIWWAPLWWNLQAWNEEHFNRICKYAWICSCDDWLRSNSAPLKIFAIL